MPMPSSPDPDAGFRHECMADRIDGSLDLTAAAVSPGAGPFPGNFPRNEVRLSGRISAIGEPSTLPSGDVVVNLRLVVPREHPVGRSGGTPEARSPGVDTIDVACWTPATRRAAGRVGIGGMAEVTGVLRRRFFRTGGRPGSRYEVEATRVRRAREAAGTATPSGSASSSLPGTDGTRSRSTGRASSGHKSSIVESLSGQ